MHFTKRLLERGAPGALVIVCCLVAAGAIWACGSDESPSDGGSPDASDDADAARPPQDAADEDATPVRDAGPIDASPLPIVCGTGPCAVALVTTGDIDIPETTDEPPIPAKPSLAEGFCALMQDGTVVCWGVNQMGQLGRADEPGSIDSATPARVAGLKDIVSLNHMCAVDKDGATYCWGRGPYLQSKTNSITIERTPVKLPIPAATRVAVGGETACAVVAGSVLCWGSNANGQVAPFDTMLPDGVALTPQAIALGTGAQIRDIVVGNATFITRTDGTTESWGANPPLGRQSPLFPDSYPQPISLAGIANLDLTRENGCAAAGGVGYCWGSVIPKFTDWPVKAPIITNALPEPVSMPEHVVQIASTTNLINYDFGTPIAQPQRWCAVSPAGNVYCWGYNASGQAGDGTKMHAYKAVKVTGLSAPAAQVKTTYNATCAILTNGKISCWGSNFYGQLGNGRIKVPSVVPQDLVLP